jgi:hypothetical protein
MTALRECFMGRGFPTTRERSAFPCRLIGATNPIKLVMRHCVSSTGQTDQAV